MEETPLQPTFTPIHPVSPVVSTSKPKSHAVLWIAAGAIILVIGIGIGLILGRYSPKPKQITSYEECVKANGNQITLMFPGTCTTRDGRQFTQPLTDEEKKNLEPPSDPTANWKTYRNEKYGFLFKYPSEWEIQTDNIHYNERYYGEGFYLRTCSTSALGVSLLDLSRPDAVYKSVDNYLKTAPSISPAIQWKDIYVAGIPGKYYKEIGDPGSVTPSASVVLFNKFKNSIVDLHFTDPCGKGIDQAIKNEFDQILSTFKFIAPSVTPTSTPIPTTSKPKTTYTVPTSWKRLTTQSGLNLCMPPKWEVEAYDHLIFNRDGGYKPSITYITNLPYSGGSRREAYFTYWVQEYPDVKQLVSVVDTDINGNSALTIHPANSSDPKTSPEGLTVVWYAAGKLWKAGLSGWNMTNTSQTSFLKDFYTMISCSF